MSASEQARKDALADAETLRAIALDPLGNGLVWWHESEEFRMQRAVWDIPARGEASVREIARAAFRAVPGLRGDGSK